MDTQLKPRFSILVVEDNDDLREMTVGALARQGHRVEGVDCAEAINEAFARLTPNILLLDLNLPGEDGISLARRIRTVNPGLGIVMLTARKERFDIINGYDSGADIYLTKPTSIEELDAAIQALGRRLRRAIPESAPFPDALQLKMASRQLSGPDGSTPLTSVECRILATLAQAQDQFLETWQLIEVSGKEVDTTTKSTLEVQIVRLRKKLDQVGSPLPAIKSIRSTGYQLLARINIA